MAFCTSSRRSSAELTTQIFSLIWRRRPESNRCMRVLQTLALPLGYAASLYKL